MKYLIVVVMMLSSLTHSAGFNCAKASTKDEHAICGNHKLSELDMELSILYRAIPRKEGIKAEQIEWIKSRRQCLDDIDCIEASYKARIDVLKAVLHAQASTVSSGDQPINRPVNGPTQMPASAHQGNKNTLDAEQWSARKAERASQLLQGLTAAPLGNINKNAFTSHSFEYCERFFDDVKSGKNIEFIKPNISTESYDDPDLMKYREKSVYELNNLVFRKLGVEEGQTLEASGNYDYRIYEGDIDNKPENGLETLFFAGNWGISSHFKLYRSNSNGRMNFSQSIQTQVTVIEGNVVPSSLVELVNYRDNIFVLSMGSFGSFEKPPRKLKLHLFGDGLSEKVNDVCVFKLATGVSE
ncbi:lysozyme inhibitor LprI family protein [Teredinibacter turnerae]|uniref:lysozyme inhibitor LprI family protein n=1 Tax=Teredinibacter turnerae TaxID=2426 RepID=UPI0003748252|nr:hypothetical protein [Teredinibacter turnerae]